MAFRRKGVERPGKKACWCGSATVVTEGFDTDDKPYAFVTCTADIFHFNYTAEF